MTTEELDQEVREFHAQAHTYVTQSNQSFKAYRRIVRRRIELIHATTFPDDAAGLKEELIASCQRELTRYQPRLMPKRLTGAQYRKLRAQQLRQELEDLCGRLAAAMEHERKQAHGKSVLAQVREALATAEAAWPKNKKRKKRSKG